MSEEDDHQLISADNGGETHNMSLKPQPCGRLA